MALATPISWTLVVLPVCLGLCVETNQTRADTPVAESGFAASAKQNFQAAQVHYREAPGEATASWKFARACFDLAEFATSSKDRASLAEQGIAAAQQAIARESNSAPAHYYLGMNLGPRKSPAVMQSLNPSNNLTTVIRLLAAMWASVR